MDAKYHNDHLLSTTTASVVSPESSEVDISENEIITSPKLAFEEVENGATPTGTDRVLAGPSVGNTKHQLANIDTAISVQAEPNGDIAHADWLKCPKSPSSIFSCSTLPDSSSSIIAGVLLCYWDNILGPKIRHLWTSELKDSPLQMKTLNFIANHTLSGEICRDLLDPSVDSKFYVLRDKQVIVTSFVFGGMGKGDLAVHSLSVIIPYVELTLYLNWHQLCVSHVSHLVVKLRILLEKECSEAAIEKFSTELSDFAHLIKSLQEASLPTSIPLSDTIFHPDHQVDETFLRRAITSHLMTCGHSVVLGNSPRRVNLMVATLATFLTPKERLLCRYVVTDRPWTYLYNPELCVQGIIKGSDLNLAFYLQGVYISRHPTTLIDLSSLEVRLSSLPHQHWAKRRQALQNEVLALWHGQEPDYPTGDIFRSFDDPETIVTNFTEEMKVIPAGHCLREAYPENLLRLLERKAFTLIRYIEAESQQGKVPIRHLKKIRHNLSLTVPGDFKMVLSAAEKLKPGIYHFVCGSSTHVPDNL